MKMKISLLFMITASLLDTASNDLMQIEENTSTSTNVSCAPWTHFEINNHTEQCTCNKALKNLDGKVECNQYTKRLSVLDCHCMTYNSSRNTLEVGSCIENCVNVGKSFRDKLYHLNLNPNANFSTVNEQLCRHYFNRAGRLCGKCLPWL